MARSYKTGIVITGDPRGGVKAIRLTRDELSSLNNKQKKTGQSADDLKARFDAMAKRLGWVRGEFKSTALITENLGSAFAALSIGQFASAVVDVSQKLEGFRAALFSVTDDQDKANQELAYARAHADKLGLSLNDTTGQYVKLAAAAKGTTLEGKDTRAIFEAVTSASRVLNLSADETTGALNAIQQMMSKGKVQAEELRGQLGERLPGAFNMAAAAMGKSTAELNKMLELGQVTAEDMLPKLADVLEGRYAGALEKATSGPSQSFRMMTNEWQKFLETVGASGAYDGLADLADTAAASLNLLSTNMDALIDVIETLAVLVGARLVGSFTALGGDAIQSFNKHVLTTTVKTNAFGQVISRTTGKMKLMSLAAQGLRGALNLLGGPVGATLVVGYSLYSLAQNMDETSRQTQRLTDHLGAATSELLKLDKASKLEKIKDAGEKIKALEERAKQLSESLSFQGGAQTAGASDAVLFASLAEIEENEAAIRDLNSAIMSLKASAFDDDLSEIQWINDLDSSKVEGTSSALFDLYNKYKQLAEGIGQSGAALELFNLEFKKAEVLPDNAKKKILDYAAALEQAKSAQKLDKYLKDLALENRLLAVKRDHGKKEFEVQKALAKFSGLTAVETAEIREQVEAQLALNAALDVQKEKQKALKFDASKFDDLIDKAKTFGVTMSDSGNAIVSAFGSVGQHLNQMVARQADFNKLQKQLQTERKKVNELDDPKKRLRALSDLTDAEKSLADNRLQANMQSYAGMANAAGQFFGENSKAREKLHRIETTFTLIETALALKKAHTSALAAIAKQGEGDPYTAFARIAAMAALMAGLGLFSGSVSGTPVSSKQRQEEQGTGTVLGDSSAKSSSISNALERMVELETEQYAELRSMNDALRTLNINISGLAGSLARRYGDFGSESYDGQLGKISDFSDTLSGKLGSLGFAILDPLDKLLGGFAGGIVDSIIGGFSSTKKTLEDSGIGFRAQSLGNISDTGTLDGYTYFDIKKKKKRFWGASSSTSYYTDYGDLNGEIERELALVFTSIGDSINAAVDVLGLDVRRSLDNFVISISNLSLKDLSAEEAQAELEAVLSQQADYMARYLVPNIGQWQKAGEGMYDTLIRVAQEQAIFNAALDQSGLELSRFGQISADVQITIAQNIVELMGGLETFSEATSTYFNEFFSESEQFEWLATSMRSQFASLYLTLPDSREGFKALVESIDLTTEEGQKLYASLMQLVPNLDAYYDGLEKVGEAEEALASKREQINQDLREQLAALDRTPLEQTLHELTRAYLEQYDVAREAGAETGLLTELYTRQYADAIEQALKEANDKAQSELDTLQGTFDSAVDSLTRGFEQLTQALGSTKAGLANSVLSVRRQQSGWDEAGYQGGVIDSLYGQLGTGDIASQAELIDELNNAVMARYNAELANAHALQDEAQARFDAEIEAYNTLLEAIRSMQDAADSLLLSDLSTLTNEERLSEAQRQYEVTLTQALAGDVDAINNLQTAADAYLSEAQTFYASGDDYQAIFDGVLAAYQQVGNLTPDVVNAPELAVYEAEALALQEAAISELLSLRDQTAALEAQAQSDFNQAMDALNATLATDRQAIIQKLDEEIDAIERLEAKLSAPPPPPPPPPVEVVVTPPPDTGLRDQLIEQTRVNEEMRDELASLRAEMAASNSRIERYYRERHYDRY